VLSGFSGGIHSTYFRKNAFTYIPNAAKKPSPVDPATRSVFDKYADKFLMICMSCIRGVNAHYSHQMQMHSISSPIRQQARKHIIGYPP
jgi:hypothetical protein